MSYKVYKATLKVEKYYKEVYPVPKPTKTTLQKTWIPPAWTTEDLDWIDTAIKTYKAAGKTVASDSPALGSTTLNTAILTKLRKSIPNLNRLVEHPCDVRESYYAATYSPRTPVWKVIISLNDVYNWTREQIADWTETLDFDLSFSNPLSSP